VGSSTLPGVVKVKRGYCTIKFPTSSVLEKGGGLRGGSAKGVPQGNKDILKKRGGGPKKKVKLDNSGK